MVFTKDPHQYIRDGTKELVGVTTLLKKHGLSPDYSNISKEVLDHAADMGTQAHQAIEDYINGKAMPEIPLVKSFRKLGLDIIATEYLVTDFDVVASSIDLVAKVDDTTVDLIDMKRTSTVHKDSVSWQVSIYAYLFEKLNPTIRVRNLYCLPIKKGNADDILKDKCQPLVELQRISEWEVRALIDNERMGTLFEKHEEDDPTTELAKTFVQGNYPALAASLKQMKILEKMIEDAKAGILDFMTEHGVESLDLDGISVSYKKPYFSQRFDTKSFRKDYPELAEQYTYSAEVAGSITIKLK